jgi:hypothetical protein
MTENALVTLRNLTEGVSRPTVDLARQIVEAAARAI